jgi:hypothetical protein
MTQKAIRNQFYYDIMKDPAHIPPGVKNCPAPDCFRVAAKVTFNLGDDSEEEAIIPDEDIEVFF